MFVYSQNRPCSAVLEKIVIRIRSKILQFHVTEVKAGFEINSFEILFNLRVIINKKNWKIETNFEI